MLDWGTPDERDAANRLEDYVDGYIPAAIDRVRELSGVNAVNVLGYCMGGVLAMLHAAHHPASPLTSLTVLTTPGDLRVLGPMTDMLSRADLDDVLGADGMVPPSILQQGFRTLAPMGEVTSRVNLLERMWSDEFVSAHQAMTGWGSDHVALRGGVAGQLREFVETNALVNDRVMLGGDRVRLADIRIPFLHVLGTRDHIIPVESAGAVVGLVGSEDRREMRFDAGHVGLLVGRSASQNTVPVLIDYMTTRSEAAS